MMKNAIVIAIGLGLVSHVNPDIPLVALWGAAAVLAYLWATPRPTHSQ